MDLDSPLLIGAGGAPELAAALRQSRQAWWPLVQGLAQGLGPALELRYLPEHTPPRWQLGHLGWLEDWWLARNPLRLQGLEASATAPRAAARSATEDAALDPRRVGHTGRWHQPLPAWPAIGRELAQRRACTLGLLAALGRTPAPTALEPFRALLWHEDHERSRWLQLAQSIGHWPGDALPAWPAPIAEDGALTIPAGEHALGLPTEAAWRAPDEGGARTVGLPAYEIDRHPVRWGRFLPFQEAGGYEDPQWWSPAGWSWRQRQNLTHPRALARDEDGGWKQAHFGRWVPLDLAAPAVHLSLHEAEAWCRWADRRLPTADEWEAAARTTEGISWGVVLEWTADPATEPAPEEASTGAWVLSSCHAPRPTAGGRILCGASAAQAPRLHRPWARHTALPEELSGFHGFRTCAGTLPAAEPAAPPAAEAAPPKPRSRAKPKAAPGVAAADVPADPARLNVPEGTPPMSAEVADGSPAASGAPDQAHRGPTPDAAGPSVAGDAQPAPH
jgi:formylglycine-generating enzyme required for sulfatase activity